MTGVQTCALPISFTAPVGSDDAGQQRQEGTCTLPNGTTVSFLVDDEAGAEVPGARVYAGLRMDPLFIDGSGYVRTLGTQRVAFQPDGRNEAEGWNILSIVVDLDLATMVGAAPGSLFAVAAETVAVGKFPIRLERFGRVFVKNQLLGEFGVDTVNGDLDLRELYNQEDVFDMAPNYLGAYRARLNANLAYLDDIDGKTDWPLQLDGVHPLTELYLGDYQVVDVSKPYREDSYLEIEQALVQGRPHATCGGRSLNDDATDSNLTFVVNAGNGPRISDGVDQATVRASQSFPYLAPPNPDATMAGRFLVPSKLADQLAFLEAAFGAPTR